MVHQTVLYDHHKTGSLEMSTHTLQAPPVVEGGLTLDATVAESMGASQDASDPPDSGYLTQQTSPDQHENDKEGEPLFPRQGNRFSLWPRKELFLFKKEIDPGVNRRYECIYPQIEKLLWDYLGPGKGSDISIRLLIVGKCELEAEAHIVVFCPKTTAKKVRRFFDKEVLVKELCQPLEFGLPSLSAVVVPKPPKQRSQAIEIFDATEYIPDQTLCGQPIYLVNESGTVSRSTIGGVLKVVGHDGGKKLFGLTTGHSLLEPVLPEEVSDSSSTSEEESSPEYSDYEEDGEDNNVGPPECKKESLSIEAASWLGRVFQVSASGSAKYFDWALLEMEKPLPNLLLQSDERGSAQKPVSTVVNADTTLEDAASEAPSTSRTAIMMRNPNNLIHGSISDTFGRIKLGPGKAFTKALLLSLDDGSGKFNQTINILSSGMDITQLTIHSCSH